MTGGRATEQPRGGQAIRVVGLPGPVPVVVLACTACQHVYEPTVADFGTGNTGCRRCGGWTWIAQLGGACGPESPDPAVTPPRTPAGSGSPTTSR